MSTHLKQLTHLNVAHRRPQFAPTLPQLVTLILTLLASRMPHSSQRNFANIETNASHSRPGVVLHTCNPQHCWKPGQDSDSETSLVTWQDLVWEIKTKAKTGNKNISFTFLQVFFFSKGISSCFALLLLTSIFQSFVNLFNLKSCFPWIEHNIPSTLWTMLDRNAYCIFSLINDSSIYRLEALPNIYTIHTEEFANAMQKISSQPCMLKRTCDKHECQGSCSPPSHVFQSSSFIFGHYGWDLGDASSFLTPT